MYFSLFSLFLSFFLYNINVCLCICTHVGDLRSGSDVALSSFVYSSRFFFSGIMSN